LRPYKNINKRFLSGYSSVVLLLMRLHQRLRRDEKTILNCHSCAGTLDGGDIDGDGELTVLDIDHIIV